MDWHFDWLIAPKVLLCSAVSRATFRRTHLILTIALICVAPVFLAQQPPANSSRKPLLQVVRVTANQNFLTQSCVIVYTDGFYHRERRRPSQRPNAHGFEVSVYEGSLSAGELGGLVDVTRSENFRALRGTMGDVSDVWWMLGAGTGPFGGLKPRGEVEVTEASVAHPDGPQVFQLLNASAEHKVPSAFWDWFKALQKRKDKTSDASANSCAAEFGAASGRQMLGSSREPITRFVPQLVSAPMSRGAADKTADKVRNVQLKVDVNADGTVSDATVTHGVDPGLNAAALEAVKRWRFAPGRLFDIHLPSTVSVQVPFPSEGNTEEAKNPPAGRSADAHTADATRSAATAPQNANTQAQKPPGAPTFNVNVNLVPVRVVVRDASGHTIGNLTKDDFLLFDNGKRQNISQFSVEKIETRDRGNAANANISDDAPKRYVAFLFDDLNLEGNDLFTARDAADKYLKSLLPGSERVAILKASGGGVDLTDDYAKLHEVLAGLKPRGRAEARPCPYMTYYMADAIVNQDDEFALGVATRDALQCAFDGDPRAANAARTYARSVAREKNALGRAQADAVLGVMKHLVAAMANAPGERTIVVVSPGFLSDDPKHAQVLDAAVRDDIVISALDPRGLMLLADITQRNAFNSEKLKYKSLSDSAEAAVLEDLADATGGVFFHNNNDVSEGFRRVSSRPEYSYVLAFSPENMKADGKFHKLKVKLSKKSMGTVQARKGYYLPKPGA